MGGDILRRFKVIFDYTRKRMILEPNSQFDESFEYDMSGISLTAEGRDYKILRVGRVFEDTPAAEAGLRDGDQILAVDGKPSSELTWTSYSKCSEKRDGCMFTGQTGAGSAGPQD